MKSARRVARSRSGRFRLDTLREFVIAPVIYLGPLMIGAAPLLLLYWLYRPTVLMNPGLNALKVPAAMALLLPPSRPESHDDAGTSNQATLADVAEDFDQTEPADQKPKSQLGPGGSHPIVGRRSLRVAGVRRRSPAHNVGAGRNIPGQYTGMSRRPASGANAYAVNQGGRRWW